MSTLRLGHIDNVQDCLSCFHIMRELRPHLSGAQAFAEQVQRQARQGYHLLAAWQDEQIVALAGYRVLESLLYGRFLYVDDLVTAASARRLGLGGKLIEALREEAKQQTCAHLVLDTALGNSLGQRFYFRQGLLSKGLHFSQVL